jgi:hypothetical protein
MEGGVNMKRFLSLMLSLLCIFATTFGGGFFVSAETITETTTSITDENIDATNLLTRYYMYGTASKNTLFLSGTVTAIETMAKVGFKDFVVQRRASTTGTWTDTSYTVPNQLGENAAYHSFSQYPVSVAGGYYYRICANAYAKETGWFFPKSQTEAYESGSVWVPAS